MYMKDVFIEVTLTPLLTIGTPLILSMQESTHLLGLITAVGGLVYTVFKVLNEINKYNNKKEDE